MADPPCTLQETVTAYDARWIARIRSRCVEFRGCWLYQGPVHPLWGYAQVSYKGRRALMHRRMYELCNGVTLTREQYVCHSCDQPHCCNPAHLWVGSNSDNQKDSIRKSRHYESRRTHCERGHEFSPENTVIRKTVRGTDRRVCKACERIRYRMALGWSEEDAMRLPKVPFGYTKEHVR